MTRKNPLVNGMIYHIISRSIAKYQIFNFDRDYLRMTNLMRYYQVKEPPTKFSMFLRLRGTQEYGVDEYFYQLTKNDEKIIKTIAYCIMPNHIHFVLNQLKDGGISRFMSNILNSYSRYFNILHKRKGPLWESRFKHILVDKDEQLLHLTRYVHLNPTSAKLVKKPEDWKYSSYREYVNSQNSMKISDFEDILDIETEIYQKFVNDRKDYQQKLSLIKKITDP